jgi:hypothetical protein
MVTKGYRKGVYERVTKGIIGRFKGERPFVARATVLQESVSKRVMA